MTKDSAFVTGVKIEVEWYESDDDCTPSATVSIGCDMDDCTVYVLDEDKRVLEASPVFMRQIAKAIIKACDLIEDGECN